MTRMRCTAIRSTMSGAEHGNLGFDYHVEHHQKPARHWSQYYEEYARAAEKDGGHPAIVMQKDQFGPLALMAALWRKDYPRSPATLACATSLKIMPRSWRVS